jgi:hypothetical protein
MSINVEAWETLISCGQISAPLAAIARSGDIESIENALEAGAAKVGFHHYLVAAAELVDADSFFGCLTPRAEDVLMKWASAYSADELSHAMIALTSSIKPRPYGCAVLVRAGADPYREVDTSTGKKKRKISAVESALTYCSVDAVKNLVSLLGTASVTDPTQLPRRLDYTNTSLFYSDACNALEFAIATQNSHAAAWLISRIDLSSPARELLFDLGDIALRFLRMDRAGESLAPSISLSNSNLSNAYRFIAGGAEFRSPDVWEKVFNSNISHNNGQPYLSSAVVRGRSEMTDANFYTCLGIFIDNGCLKIDAPDDDGHTMLMNAAKINSHEVVDLLLQRGASVAPTATIEGRKTPVDALHYAKKSKNPEMIGKILAATAKQAITRTIDKVKAGKDDVTERAAP